MTNVLIVGAGLFGSMAAILAAKAGHSVTLFDDGRALAGSKPAACLMKPGWMSGLGPIADEGLRVLDETFGLRTLKFNVAPGVDTEVFWVPPSAISSSARAMASDMTSQSVMGPIDDGLLFTSNGHNYRGTILVAAGVWSNDLITGMPPIRRLAGAAFTFRGEVEKPLIRAWAPYKQVVAFSREPGTTWIGDGSSILENNWTVTRQMKCFDRCVQYAPPAYGRRVNVTLAKPVEVGLRPYVEGHKAGYFRQVSPKLFVSTGGAKNGTVLAAYYAKKFLEALR